MGEDFEVVIGLEVHVELNTESKAFCGCSTKFGAEPNTHVCPVCLGLPGSLPVVNKRAVEYAVKTALALNCQVARYSKFDRKNYFYPDMPKNYQISQYDLPIGRNGWVNLSMEGHERRIRIRRVHLEEDTGKLLHEGVVGGSLVDFNRAGVPLLEIVSEPDIRSPEEARLYLAKLRNIVQYAGVSDCKMEEGSLRCDANISIRPKGSSELGVLTEVKNMNSFRSVKLALEHEVERQTRILRAGGTLTRETRHWDEARGVTFPSRSKEEAHDYRYFPDPDLVPVIIDDDWLAQIRNSIPELPDEKQKRYMEQLGLPAYDAEVITSSYELARFFERCIELGGEPKTVSNWLMGDVLRLLNEANLEIQRSRLTPEHLTKMIRLINEGTISGKIGKTVLEKMFCSGQDPEEIIRQEGLVQISDESQLESIIDQVIKDNPEPVNDFRNGKEKALTFLVGKVMQASRGRANPGLVNQILRRKLS